MYVCIYIYNCMFCVFMCTCTRKYILDACLKYLYVWFRQRYKWQESRHLPGQPVLHTIQRTICAFRCQLVHGMHMHMCTHTHIHTPLHEMKGVMMASYLLYGGLRRSALSARSYYDAERTCDKKALTAISQIRCVYFRLYQACSGQSVTSCTCERRCNVMHKIYLQTWHCAACAGMCTILKSNFRSSRQDR